MRDLASIRGRFPALARTLHGAPVIYADAPGGTQVPDSVIEAMTSFLARGGSNLGGPFVTSEETAGVVASARSAVADLLNAASGEVVFGQNMTSLTLSLARALSRTWSRGDQIVCTRLDHDANVSPWMIAAAEVGAEVRMVDFDPHDGRLSPDAVATTITDRTRLVAVTHASNALGTIVDVAAITRAAHAAGALVFVDAVHYAPHGSIDVRAIGCDFLTASAYKFFGPHTGVLFGRGELLARLDAVKIRPAPDEPPGKWETGTQSFESLAGVAAAVDYLAWLGEGATRRDRLVTAMRDVVARERRLSAQFLAGVADRPPVQLFGVPEPNDRTPTFAVDVAGHAPHDVAAHLGRRGIFVWDGHFYAPEVIRRLGRLENGGLVRIGFAHYATTEEVDRTLEALTELC